MKGQTRNHRASRRPPGEKIPAKEIPLELVFYVTIVGFAVATFLPFWVVLANSLRPELELLRNGYVLFPESIDLSAYRYTFENGLLGRAYLNTVFITAVGTALSMTFTSALAFGLVTKSVAHRNKIAFFVYFTMIFRGGIVPTFILIRNYLHLSNTLWVMILPFLINPWNMFLLRNFFATVPHELIESCKLDGASEVRTLVSVVLPVSLPALATVGLFYALFYWNEWFHALLFIEKETLFPLQYQIIKILREVNTVVTDPMGRMADRMLPSKTVQMATGILTIGPIVFVYPFLQKYFVKGLTLGSIKG